MSRILMHCQTCGWTDQKEIPGWTGPSKSARCPRCWARAGLGLNQVVDRAHEEEERRRQYEESKKLEKKASEDRLKRWEEEERRREEDLKARGLA